MIVRSITRNLWVQYLLLALAIMSPLLMPGFVLTLDLVFTPHIAWPTELSNTWLFQVVLYVVNIVLPGDVIEKLLLLIALVAAGVGAHRLLRDIAPYVNKKYLVWGCYFAGIFYMINPFVYSRFMAGQYLVLLGYALTPFFVSALMRLLAAPDWRNALPVALWGSVIVGISLHHAGILLLLAIGVCAAMAWRYRTRLAHIKKAAIFGGVALAVTLLANAYWLAPTLAGGTNISTATASFNDSQYAAFATNNQGGLGTLGNVVRLQGFWADAEGAYILPQQQVPAWGLVMAALWFVAGVGAVKAWRSNRSFAIALIAVAVAAILLAATPLVSWLAHIIPFVAGYREPQKFVAILALVYALFAGVGVAEIIGRLHKAKARALSQAGVAGLFVLPILCTPTLLWGCNGQLVARQYPTDWYTVNDTLNATASATKVLFLPWHEYMNFSFSKRVIANPAPKFFDKPTVAGDNPEFKNIEPTVPNATNRRIEQEVLAGGDRTAQLGQRLSSFGFSHVVLAKEYDYLDYAYLDAQTDLRLVQDTDTLRVYEVVKNSGGTHE